MKEVWCGIWRKLCVCGPLSLAGRVVVVRPAVPGATVVLRGPPFLSPAGAPPTGSDSLVIRLYGTPALLPHNASHNSVHNVLCN